MGGRAAYGGADEDRRRPGAPRRCRDTARSRRGEVYGCMDWREVSRVVRSRVCPEHTKKPALTGRRPDISHWTVEGTGREGGEKGTLGSR